MRVTILGLGAMGERMAGRLLEAGHELRLYNRTAARAEDLVARGAVRFGTPKEAAEAAEVVISMVTDDDASRSVWLDAVDGAIFGLEPNALAIESSTVTPAWVEELGGRVEGRGAQLLDAPVAGSRPQAEAGQLIFLVGGEEAAVTRVRPLLETLGGAVHRVGSSGAGMKLKLAVNALFSIQVAALAELLTALDRNGVPPAAAMEVLAETPVLSPAAKGAGGAIVEEKFAPLFPIELVVKDLRYAVGTANTVDAELPCVAAVHGIFERAQRAGFGQDNITGVAKLFSR